MSVLLKWICYVNIEVKTLIEQYKSSFLINSNYLDYIKNMLKNTKKKYKKNQNKIYKCAKNRMK